MGLSSAWRVGVFFFLAVSMYAVTFLSILREMPKIHRHASVVQAVDLEVRETCRNTFLSPDLACPRLLKNNMTVNAGIGHQFNELLFGLQKAHSLGMSYVFEPFEGSKHHNDSYAFINDLLGLPRLFSRLGGFSKQEVERILATTSSSWRDVGVGRFTSDDCNVFRSVQGWKYCTSRNCFKAPEHAYLYQDAMDCLRKAVAAYGTAFDRCFFSQIFTDVQDVSTAERLLPNDTVVVVWHVRLGDRILHTSTDPMFERLMSALKEITEGYKILVLLVGKGTTSGDGTYSVTQEYVESVSKLAETIWAESDTPPIVTGPTLTIEDTFLAMMQADLLIGSGSHLPAIAALVSAEPLYFNHVPKSGYLYGAELMADSVDLDSNGTILDSHRRVRVALHDRMHSGNRRVCR
jgi:hypothetical protein